MYIPAADQVLQMQPAALVLLAVYVAAVLVLAPRELAFIRDVSQPLRGQFIVADIVLQICILAVLVPSASTDTLTPLLMWFIVSGFTLLWPVAGWMASARQKYINRILEDSHQEGKRLMAELSRMKREEQAKEESGD